MKHYEGCRTRHSVTVAVNGRPLNPRLDLYNHSPAGFEWGYGGSGPALALLADHLADDDQALEFYQRFKWAMIAGLPRNCWTLTSCEIDQALQNFREQDPSGGGA